LFGSLPYFLVIETILFPSHRILVDILPYLQIILFIADNMIVE